MIDLYVLEAGSILSKDGGKIIIKKDEETTIVPGEMVRSVVLSRSVQITSQLLCDFMKRSVTVFWLDSYGKLIGNTIWLENYENIELQKRQFEMYDDSLANLEIARKSIQRKLENQITVLKSYNRTERNVELDNIIMEIAKFKHRLSLADNYQKLMGYEGVAGRLYYSALSKLIPEEFNFNGRNRKPPKDSVNAMLSFCYTLLYREIFC